jgi:hypothetical protein
VLRVSRSIADLSGRRDVGRVHIAEALSYRRRAPDELRGRWTRGGLQTHWTGRAPLCKETRRLRAPLRRAGLRRR